MTIKFGRIYKPDDRDKRYRIQRRTSLRTRRYWPINWRLNQRETPHCVGYAWAHWLLSSPISQYCDPDGIYRLAQFLDPWDGEGYPGTTVRAGADVLKSLGFIKEYRWAWSLPPLIDALLEAGPVVAGVQWREGMMNPDGSGYIHATGDVIGGHAILMNGVNTVEEKIRVHQSWDWSHAWISFADMRRLLKDKGECCLAIEAKPEPKGVK